MTLALSAAVIAACGDDAAVLTGVTDTTATVPPATTTVPADTTSTTSVATTTTAAATSTSTTAATTTTTAVTTTTTKATTTTTGTLALPLEWWRPANYGTEDLTTGFLPDPHGVSVASGGSVNVFSFLGMDCVGFATQAPDLEVDWTGGGASGLLRFYFIADTPGEDAALVVSDSDSNWACYDDSFGTLNPTADYDSHDSGVYDIWVASVHEGTAVYGTLYITEIPTNHP